MTNETREIPAGACILNAGEFTFERKNESDKSGALRMVARSGKPIEHWYWGNVVHDLSGMTMHKGKIPVDYVHDPKEIIGYLNHFDHSTGDLVASGALVPFKENDRATEIMHKMAAGVPYEASINFGGDGIKVEEIAAGQVAQVNGYEFAGPGMIVREWPLRGVAVCPYGADSNTESAATFANSNAKIKASVTSAPKPTEEAVMSNDNPVDVATAEVPEPEQMSETEATEEATVENVTAEATELEATEELAAVENEETVEATQDDDATAESAVELTADEAPVEAQALSADEFIRIADKFGNDIAAQIVRDGGDYAKALELHADSLATKLATAEAQLAEATMKSAGSPVRVSERREVKPMFNVKK